MAYSYRLPRRYRYRAKGGSREALAAVAVFVVLASATGTKAAAHRAGWRAATGNAVAEEAVAYARQQLGKPYVWGATGPDAFDCSGLVMMAYRPAGITFGSSRPTADTEWQAGPRVSTPERGDLVFFAGADGTPADPGHVGIVTDPAAHTMIDAYASGYPVEYDTYGPGASRPGLSDPVGFSQPWGA